MNKNEKNISDNKEPYKFYRENNKLFLRVILTLRKVKVPYVMDA